MCHCVDLDEHVTGRPVTATVVRAGRALPNAAGVRLVHGRGESAMSREKYCGLDDIAPRRAAAASTAGQVGDVCACRLRGKRRPRTPGLSQV